MTVVEGSTVVLVCTAEGSPTPHVTWIAPNGTVLQNRTTDTNLTLPNVSRYSSGTYQCNARNELGSDSATVKLDVWCKYFVLVLVHFIYLFIFWKKELDGLLACGSDTTQMLQSLIYVRCTLCCHKTFISHSVIQSMNQFKI